MRKILPWAIALVLSGAAASANAAPKKPNTTPKATNAAPSKPATAPETKAPTLRCVGLYSETDAGYVSFRSGTGSWTVIKVGDTIPADAEIKVTVDRDWVELAPTDNPNAVYELNGESGPVTKSVADILKGTSEGRQGSEGERWRSRIRPSRTSWSSRSTWDGRSIPTPMATRRT